MHPYSLDKDIRRTAVLGVFMASLGLSYLINSIEAFKDVKVVANISSLSIFALLWFVFDIYAWRLFAKLKIIQIPILAGEWEGSYTSSKTKFACSIKINVVIKQTFFGFGIYFHNDTGSNSRSEMACFMDGQSSKPVLMYEYINDPPDKKFPIHRGTCRLIYSARHETLVGEYYNDSHNGNWGNITLAKVSCDNC